MTKREQETLTRLQEKKAAEEKQNRAEQRQLQKLCKSQFGGTISEIRQRLTAQSALESTLQPLLDFYGLTTITDLRDFVDIMRSDSSRSYFRRQLSQRSVDDID